MYLSVSPKARFFTFFSTCIYIPLQRQDYLLVYGIYVLICFSQGMILSFFGICIYMPLPKHDSLLFLAHVFICFFPRHDFILFWHMYLSVSPKGLSLSTSLKFDLARLANTTLRSETKSRLKRKARELFSKRTAELRAEKILDLINDQNMEAVFQGFQSIPEVKGNTVEVKMSSSKGSITSFGFGQPYSGRSFILKQPYSGRSFILKQPYSGRS